MTQTPLSTYLFMTEGSSDKAYQVHLVQEGDGWMVTYANGRRGSTLKTGLKTTAPLPYADALNLYEKTVASKKKGGYTEDISGQAYANTALANSVTGFQPKLLNPIDESEATGLLSTWASVYMQIKRDGERRGVLTLDGTPTGANRSGLAVACAADVQAALTRVCVEAGCAFDSEDMGGHLYIFDILLWQHIPLTDMPFTDRIFFLEELKDWIKDAGLSTLLRVDLPVRAQTQADIHAFIAQARADHEEGVVFLDGAAPYTAGRPASGGSIRKLKFVESATVRVRDHTTGKRSVGMEVQNGGTWRGVGSVTIPPNKAIPTVGSLIEVGYLYAYPNGSLFQPTYLGPRTDVGLDSARESQLKYKFGTAALAAADA
jgi:bifunctional non-homologous end joining protein LigD